MKLGPCDCGRRADLRPCRCQWRATIWTAKGWATSSSPTSRPSGPISEWKLRRSTIVVEAQAERWQPWAKLGWRRRHWAILICINNSGRGAHWLYGPANVSSHGRLEEKTRRIDQQEKFAIQELFKKSAGCSSCLGNQDDWRRNCRVHRQDEGRNCPLR